MEDYRCYHRSGGRAIDLFFVADIILMFFTSFQDSKGKEQWDSFIVARNYMNTRRFVFDIISILGIKVIESTYLKWCGFAKMARISRLNTYINSLNIQMSLKTVV